MKRFVLTGAGALVVAAVVGTSGASAAPAGENPKATHKVVNAACNDATTGEREGTFTYDGPAEAWPPNHKYVTALISLTDDDGDVPPNGATVAVTGTHDQVAEDGTEMTGSGNTDPATDVVPGAPGAGDPTATTNVQFRAERSGHKWTDGDPWRGRTYTFTVTGTTDNGTTTCEPVQFTANVPHDQGNHNGSSKKGASRKTSLKRSKLARSAR